MSCAAALCRPRATGVEVGCALGRARRLEEEMRKRVDAQCRPPTGGLTRRALLRGAAAAAAALSSNAVAAAQSSAQPKYVPRPSATEYVLHIATASAAPDDGQSADAVLI